MSLATQVSALATTIGNAIQADRAARGDLTSLTTTDKSSIVNAINEAVASISGAGATINDAATATSSVWSSDKTNTEIGAAVAALVNAAPGALDDLNELAAAIGDDANFAATISAELGNRLRYDATQTLSGPQQVQAQANMGATSSTDIGSVTTDFVAAFTTALAD